MKKQTKPKKIINQKMFIVRKYIIASSAKEAIHKDKTTPVDDVYIDSDFQKKQFEQLASGIGFSHNIYEDYE